MKLSNLKQIIKEEIRNVLENEDPTNVGMKKAVRFKEPTGPRKTKIVPAEEKKYEVSFWYRHGKGGDEKDNGKLRFFDAPDFLFPNHMWVAMSAAGVWWRWLFYPICFVFHLVFLIGHTLGNHNEENQMFFECLSFNTTHIYAKFNWKWRKRNYFYWQERNEIDYHFMMEDMVEGLT